MTILFNKDSTIPDVIQEPFGIFTVTGPIPKGYDIEKNSKKYLDWCQKLMEKREAEWRERDLKALDIFIIWNGDSIIN